MKSIILTLSCAVVLFYANAQVQLEWAITPSMTSNDTISIFKIDVNANGIICGTGFMNGGYKTGTLCIGLDGKELWQQKTFPSYKEFSYNIVADSNFLYVVGSVFDSSIYYFDFKLIKYDYSGNIIWTSKYNSPGNGSESGPGIKVRNQYIYVNGTSTTSTLPGIVSRTIIIKYSKLTGDTIWTSIYYNSIDSCQGGGGYIDFDVNENIFIARGGLCNSHPETGTDYHTLKFDSSGAFHWFVSYDGPYVDDSICDPGSGGNPSDWTAGIGIDDSGFVYVSGSSQDCPGAGPGTDFATLKYNPADGSELWLKRYNGPSNSLDVCNAMIVDKKNSSIYATGRIKKDGIEQPGIIKYDTYGNFLWHKFPMNNNQGGPRAIALDDSGYVYIAGGAFPLQQRFITKLDTAGNVIWQELFPMATSSDYWQQIIIDKNYNVYVGRSNMIAKYCQQPSQAYFNADNDSVPPGFAVSFTNTSINATHFQWNFGDGTTDTVNFDATHAYAAAGFYTVTLATWNACGADSATLLIHVDSLFTGIASIPSPPAPQLQIHPNPNNGSFILSGFSFSHKTSEVAICSMEGKIIKKLEIKPDVNGRFHKVINTSELINGIYFVQVKFDSFIHAKRITIIK